MRRLLSSGFAGSIYPVSISQSEVLGLRAYSKVTQIPAKVDLALIIVPAAAVPQVMQDCAAHGVSGAVIISAGFAEIGESGNDLQHKIVDIAQKGGIRFVGPNSNGIISSVAKICMPFDQVPAPGPISFISQSGTFGGYLVMNAVTRGYGISKFVSIGNQADLNISDYLSYFLEDPETRVIAMYIEGVVDGRRFLEIVKQVVPRKPIVVHKGGVTEAGARATLSHTASLAGREEIFDSMCRQAGIIRATEAMHLFEMAYALATLPLPRGNRVAVLGSGGQGVVTADACVSLGLQLPEFDAQSADNIRRHLPGHAPRPRNPIDFAGGARSALEEARLLETVAQIEYIDSVIANTPVTWLRAGTSAERSDLSAQAVAIASRLPREYGKPLICQRLDWSPARMATIAVELAHAGIPTYDTPEQCARALYALTKYAEVRRQHAGEQAQLPDSKKV